MEGSEFLRLHGELSARRREKGSSQWFHILGGSRTSHHFIHSFDLENYEVGNAQIRSESVDALVGVAAGS